MRFLLVWLDSYAAQNLGRPSFLHKPCFIKSFHSFSHALDWSFVRIKCPIFPTILFENPWILLASDLVRWLCPCPSKLNFLIIKQMAHSPILRTQLLESRKCCLSMKKRDALLDTSSAIVKCCYPLLFEFYDERIVEFSHLSTRNCIEESSPMLKTWHTNEIFIYIKVSILKSVSLRQCLSGKAKNVELHRHLRNGIEWWGAIA